MNCSKIEVMYLSQDYITEYWVLQLLCLITWYLVISELIVSNALLPNTTYMFSSWQSLVD